MLRTSLWLSLGIVLAACGTENNLNGGSKDDPFLSLDDPAAAAFMREGAATATGRAEGLTSVTVNGVAATVSQNQFDAEIELERGVNIVEAVGVDELGNNLFVRHGVLAGDFADPGMEVRDAVVARVNDGGLDEIFSMASDMLTPQLVAGMITNPVYSDAYGVAGWDAVTVDASITQLWFDSLAVDAIPQAGKMYVEVQIPNLYVKVNAAGTLIAWDYSEDAEIWADEVKLAGYITLDTDNAGHLVADFDDATFDLVGFGYDISLIPGDVESWLFIDLVSDLLEGLLADQVESMLPSLLEEQLSTLEIAFETELMGKTLSIEGDFASALIDTKGVQIGLDIDVNIPGAGSNAAPGYLESEHLAAHVDQNADMGVALSDDLLNRVLFEAWGADFLKMTMSTDDGSLDPLMLAPLGADEGTIKVEAKLPPVIVQSEGGLQLQLAELEVRIETPGSERGEFIDIAVALFADLDLRVSNGTLKLDIGTPELVLHVRDSDWGASNEATTELLSQMLPIDTLLGAFGDIEFPLPVLAGIAVDSAQVARDSSGVHTGVKIQLH